MAGERYRDILVVDLLGGLGDLVMLLPAIHGLARGHRGAALRVVTHAPGSDLLRHDPAVTRVHVAPDGPGTAGAAVARALAEHQPDLAVTTTRYDRIPELLAASGARCVTDLWRRPPPDELVGSRYLRILYDEGLLGADALGLFPQVRLRPEERALGEETLAGLLPDPVRRPPVLLVPDAGMAVKRWPPRSWRTLAGRLGELGFPVLTVTAGPPAPVLPPGDLRHLAACFAAVARRGGAVVGGDTGPVRLAAAVGARTVALFGPTLASRYGLGVDTVREIQGLPDCPHRQPTAITEQVCWWDARCPLSPDGPACMSDIDPGQVARRILSLLEAASPAEQWRMPRRC
ncbi:heptosyltransferase [Micromonospora qiuiae]|uniref:Heptosyltransferase n=1 Tax=Micromonospora qiuiae TaxID=502268 RepID=A0ABQ4JK21_9ACTN|nr:glycosyltransferase family 9 protein [Micromonospora qiuiae]GIJ29889.1 heptosyltransferase [Micromonospora qiuiae]